MTKGNLNTTRNQRRRYADLAEWFRRDETPLSDVELVELREKARQFKNPLLERRVTERLARGLVLDDDQARLVGAVLELVRERSDLHHAATLAGRRVGRSELESMIVIDAVVSAIQTRMT